MLQSGLYKDYTTGSLIFMDPSRPSLTDYIPYIRFTDPTFKSMTHLTSVRARKSTLITLCTYEDLETNYPELFI